MDPGLCNRCHHRAGGAGVSTQYHYVFVDINHLLHD